MKHVKFGADFEALAHRFKILLPAEEHQLIIDNVQLFYRSEGPIVLSATPSNLLTRLLLELTVLEFISAAEFAVEDAPHECSFDDWECLRPRIIGPHNVTAGFLSRLEDLAGADYSEIPDDEGYALFSELGDALSFQIVPKPNAHSIGSFRDTPYALATATGRRGGVM